MVGSWPDREHKPELGSPESGHEDADFSELAFPCVMGLIAAHIHAVWAS